MSEIIPGPQLARLAGYGSLHLVDKTPSTNLLAISLIPKRAPALVIARQQTEGRGRFNRRWFSDDDSLTFSYLLFLHDEEQHLAPWIPQLVGLALCQTLEDTAGLEPLTRWPNDVLVRGRKVAGILCEMRGNAVIIGIGINVNQSEFPEDPELLEAGSLRQVSGLGWDKLKLVEDILERLLRAVELARAEKMDELMSAIKDRSAVLHRRVEVRTRFRRHIGTVVDIDTEGRIVLRTTNDRIVVVNAGQVRRLR